MGQLPENEEGNAREEERKEQSISPERAVEFLIILTDKLLLGYEPVMSAREADGPRAVATLRIDTQCGSEHETADNEAAILFCDSVLGVSEFCCPHNCSTVQENEFCIGQ